MGRALPFLIVLVATLVALIDCLSTDRDDVRGLPKVVWCLVILLLPVVGVIAWFFAGRPLPPRCSRAAALCPGSSGAPPPRPGSPAGAPGGGPGGGSRPRKAKPVAPDDD